MPDIQEQIKELVERMLVLNRNLNETNIPEEKRRLKLQLAALDKQIASLVYKLYDLSGEEIKIVNNFNK